MDEKLNVTEENECCCKRTKSRDGEALRSLENRLKRIEGQVRGIGNMLASDAYCIDILTQVSAVESALGAFARALLESHIRECVVEDIRFLLPCPSLA